MKDRKTPHRLLCLCAALVTLLTGTARAEAPEPGRRTGTITACFSVENCPVNGTEFRIWRVGQPDREAYLVWTPETEAYGLRLDLEDQDGLGDVARTLYSCLRRDSVEPAARAVTDRTGTARFSGLEHGLYLMAGDAYRWSDGSGTWTYRPVPTLITVWDEQEAAVEVKHNDTWSSPARRTVTRTVRKVWEDQENDAGLRPDSVTVELLRDGVVHDTETLNDANGWQHTWTGLDASREWDVLEKDVPEGYTSTVALDGLTYIVTNRQTNETPPEDPPETSPEDPPDTPPDRSPDTPENPSDVPPDAPPEETPPETPPAAEQPPVENPPTQSSPELPQTGPDWRPVWALAGASAACLVAGLLIRRREEEEKQRSGSRIVSRQRHRRRPGHWPARDRGRNRNPTQDPRST